MILRLAGHGVDHMPNQKLIDALISNTWVVEVHVDANPLLPDDGEQYLSCDACLRELANDPLLAATFSPRTYAKQQASITKAGHIQIFCVRHNANVCTFTLRAVENEGSQR